MSNDLRLQPERVTAQPSSAGYRPAVDGLRALAVIAVIVNHLEPSWWPLGYLGVDVFFVISGFVVTLSLLSRPLESRKAFLLGFYSRRLRRLLPALLVTVVVVSLLGVMVMYPGSLERITSLQTGLTALIGGSNLFLLSQNSDYFGIRAELNLFLHTWSLGVEEQFYLLFPCLWLLCGGQRRRFLALLLLLCCTSGLFQAGLLKSSWGYNASFYLMPARFWELGCGAVLALLLPQRRDLQPWLQKWLMQLVALVGCVALVLLMLRGGAPAWMSPQLAIVAVTTLVIACLESAGPVQAVLASRPIVAVGIRSYGLYLWHWPLLVLMRWTVGFSVLAAAVVAGLTVSLAWVSFAWLETPLRRRRWSSQVSRELLIGGGSVAAAASALGLLCTPAATAAFWLGRDRPEGYVPPVDFPHLAYAPVIPGTLLTRRSCFERFSFTRDVQIKPQDLERCRLAPLQANAPTIFVYGDSYAGHLSPLLSQLRADQGYGVEMLIRAQCPFPARSADPQDDCFRFELEREKRVLAAAKAGDVLLLATSAREPGGRYSSHFVEKLKHLSRELRAREVRVVFQSPTPRFTNSFDPVCVYPLQWFQSGAGQRCAAEQATARVAQTAWIQPLLDQLQPLSAKSGLEVWDAFVELCASDQARCSTHHLGRRLYRDNGHISGRGAQQLFPSLKKLMHMRLNH